MFVRAMRKEDFDWAGEVTSWMPWPVFLAGQVVQELRARDKYEGRWTVVVGHRWGFKEDVMLGEFSKADALELVDVSAAEIARGTSL